MRRWWFQLGMIAGCITFAAVAWAENTGRAAAPARPAIRELVLDNGLRVRIEEHRGGGLVAVAMSYQTGMMDHPAGRRGLPHLVEHLAMRGTKHVAKGSAVLEDVGAYTNAYTTLEATTYFAFLPRGYLERALWVESDRLGFLQAALTEANLKAEKKIVQQEWIWRNGDARGGMNVGLIMDELFPDADPRRAAVDTPEEVGTITLDDVRRYLDAHYHPNNATLAVVGDVNADEVAALARRYFGDLPRSPEPVSAAPRAQISFTGQMTVTVVSENELSKLNVFYAVPPPKDVRDTAVPRVLAARLQRALTAELVTKHAWARGVEVSHMSIGGSWFLWIGATLRRNVRHAVVEESIGSVIQVMRTGEYDVADAKRSVTMDATRQYSSLMRRAGDLAEDAQVAPLETEVRAVERVTAPEVRKYASEQLDPSRKLVVRERAATETSRVGAVYERKGSLFGGAAP